MLHEAMLGTFLQHGKTRNALKEPRTLVTEFEEQPWTFTFKALTSYAHQGAASLVTEGGIESPQELAGWLFPGGVVRHTGFSKDSALSETGDRVLLLLYAPIGGVYFRVRQRKEGARPLYALVLPEVTSLESYGLGRQSFLEATVADLTCAGTAEAGWRFLSRIHAKRLLPSVESTCCRVISFGTVPWSTQQKTRLELLEVRPGRERDLLTFSLCLQVLGPRIIKKKDGSTFLGVASSPELIAKNLAEGRPWWRGFSEFLTDKQRTEHIFNYERKGLSAMVKQGQFDDEACRRFVEVCHEAWRRRMGQLGERTRRESTDFGSLVKKEFVRQRTAFAKCKNAATLRQEVTDFWSRTGPHKLLDGWQDLLPLLDGARWQEARDLALLALASYQPASKEEEQALEEGTTGEEEGEEQ
jgi:CRISPR-associated protein Cas8a1/Csx13